MGRIFNQSAANQARTFDGNGLSVIAVDDLVTLDSNGFKVDADGDGTFETTVANDDLILRPANASLVNEPITRIQLAVDQATLARIPELPNALQVTATWGWPTVPDLVKEQCVALMRFLRDVQESGMTLTQQRIDAEVRESPMASKFIDSLLKKYSRFAMVM